MFLFGTSSQTFPKKEDRIGHEGRQEFSFHSLSLPGTGKKEKMRRGTTQSSAKAKSTPMMSIRIFSETLGVQNITKQSWGQKGQSARSLAGAYVSETTSRQVFRDPAELGRRAKLPDQGLVHPSSHCRRPALSSPLDTGPAHLAQVPQRDPQRDPRSGATEGDQLLSWKA